MSLVSNEYKSDTSKDIPGSENDVEGTSIIAGVAEVGRLDVGEMFRGAAFFRLACRLPGYVAARFEN